MDISAEQPWSTGLDQANVSRITPVAVRNVNGSDRAVNYSPTSDLAGAAPAMSVGVLSTFPPTRCGIATFTAALARSFERQDVAVTIARIRDIDEVAYINDARVTAELESNKPSTVERCVVALNACDVALIQHEYGLYDGDDGSEVVDLVQRLKVPTIAILHTVLPKPTAHQRQVLNELCAAVDSVVVMTEFARVMLLDVFDVEERKVRVIAHGASVARPARSKVVSTRPIVLTWGLLGPGKGIEWVIDALVELKDVFPRPLYVIAGQTHPKVLAAEGDRYRYMLEQRVVDNGVGELVAFDNAYRNLESLGRLIASASVVVLPYDSSEQATSGVLVDAIAAGRPVIATGFPHARELLSTGAGMTVHHRDSGDLATALRKTLSDPVFAARMAREANRLSTELSWDHVAGQYQLLAREISDSVGIGVA